MSNANTQRSLLRSDLSVGRSGLDFDGLRTLAQKYPNQFMARFEDLVAQRKITLAQLGSLRALFRSLLDVKVETRVDVAGELRTVTTSAFPLAMGSLMVAALNDAYAAVPTIGDALVTDMDSNKKFTHIAKLNHQVHEQVNTSEGAEFPLISAGESFAVIGHKRRGFRWKVTQETLDEDDVGIIAMFLREAGEFAAELNEELLLDRVTDRKGSASSAAAPYVYQPNGSGTALFVDGTSRKISNPLVSEANLEALRLLLTAQTNTRGRRIGVSLNDAVLLVPDALVNKASSLTRSEMVPGNPNEINPWGPRGLYQPKVLSTPKLDDISTSAYYLGQPQKIFVRKWKLRVETATVTMDALEFLRSRTAYEARVAWDCEIGARDNKGWVQSLSGTVAATAPS
jgi:hypothetical protein